MPASTWAERAEEAEAGAVEEAAVAARSPASRSPWKLRRRISTPPCGWLWKSCANLPIPDSEFDQVKTQRLQALKNAPTEPTQLAQESLQRHLSPYAKDDAQYSPTREEQLADMQKLTLDDVKKFHDQFFGASHGVFAILGPFDQAQVSKTAEELLGSWTTAGPYERLNGKYKAAAAHQRED